MDRRSVSKMHNQLPSLGSKRTLPHEPPEAGNRVLNTWASSSKSTTDVKSLRSAAYSAEAFRKTEATEKALFVSESSPDKIIETDEDIMDGAVSDTSDSVFGDESPRVTIIPFQTRN